MNLPVDAVCARRPGCLGWGSGAEGFGGDLAELDFSCFFATFVAEEEDEWLERLGDFEPLRVISKLKADWLERGKRNLTNLRNG